MDVAKAFGLERLRAPAGALGMSPRVVSAAEFRELLVSHRRLVRVDRRMEQMRGLQDVDTGELFLTDEQRLLNSPHLVMNF